MTQSQSAATASESVMEGGGFYNENSRPQAGAVQSALPLLTRAVEALDRSLTEPVFRMADFGASQGHNSMVPVRAVIEQVRARAGRPVPIEVTHTDLPANDFAALFELLANGAESYRRGNPDVYSAAVGQSFYAQILPPGQIALGYAAITTHWLSSVPCAIPNSIWSSKATGAVHEAFAARARADWRGFLEARARELRPGGRLVVVASAANDDGTNGAEQLMDLADDVVASMAADGTLSHDEAVRMVMPTYYRTTAEYSEFLTPATATPDTAVLTLEETTTGVVDDPLWADFERTGDKSAYAAACAGFFKAFSEPVLFNELDPSRTPEERQRIIDTLYGRMRQALAASPERGRANWRLLLLRIAKRADQAG